jgi:hypothetical protein
MSSEPSNRLTRTAASAIRADFFSKPPQVIAAMPGIEVDDVPLLGEALDTGFEGMTPPTLGELRDRLPLARETRDRVAARERQQRRVGLPELRTRLGGRYLAEIPAGPPDPLVIDRLDPTGHTILYGAGGTGKGTLATWWITQLVQAGLRVLILDYENHGDEWARRYQGLAGTEGGGDVLWTAPLTAAWDAPRGPLWGQQKEVRDLAEAFEADYLVIDSIVPGCAGADPVDPGTAARYAGALEYIERPALSWRETSSRRWDTIQSTSESSNRLCLGRRRGRGRASSWTTCSGASAGYSTSGGNAAISDRGRSTRLNRPAARPEPGQTTPFAVLGRCCGDEWCRRT